MKKLFSAKYSEGTYNTSLLALRLGVGTLLAYHGYDKLVHFNNEENIRLNFLGMGTTVSQTLLILVKLAGGLFVLAGLCTRLAVLAIALWLAFVLFNFFGGDIFARGEKVALLLIGFVLLLIAGAGKYSIDSSIENKF